MRLISDGRIVKLDCVTKRTVPDIRQTLGDCEVFSSIHSLVCPKLDVAWSAEDMGISKMDRFISIMGTTESKKKTK